MLKTFLLVLLFCSLCGGVQSLGEGGDEQELSAPSDPQGSSSLQQRGAGGGDLTCIENSFQLVINLRDEVRELRETVSTLKNHLQDTVSSLKSQLAEQRKQGTVTVQ